MKTVILVIASTNTPLYIHYIKTYWTTLIDYTNYKKPDIDVFLLFNGDTDEKYYKHIRNNVIIDTNKTTRSPGILQKTIYAFEKLQHKYDVFFRTNLSGIINIDSLEKYITNNKVIYSGGIIWHNALRENIKEYNLIDDITELDSYPGNTFISGSGFLLNRDEVRNLIKQKNKIRFDIIDDVSIGLMMLKYQDIPNFTEIIVSGTSLKDKIKQINKNRIHARLQWFTLEEARELWNSLSMYQIQL
tara:strand:- start:1954 stop:2688 length:735 start_codon:yes stop_codon:yes gene_type:complete